MRKQCACGKGFDLHYKQRKQLLHGFELFCGGDCLYWYLLNNPMGYMGSIIEKNPRVYPSQMDEPFDYYCPITKRFYRSKSEATFAIWCDTNRIEWKYEPYTIMLDYKKVYNPDFWLPKFGHFIEVKGSWSGSAKKKLKMTVERGFRILLIPDYLIRILGRKRDSMVSE